jgi:hypothetical protein
VLVWSPQQVLCNKKVFEIAAVNLFGGKNAALSAMKWIVRDVS